MKRPSLPLRAALLGALCLSILGLAQSRSPAAAAPAAEGLAAQTLELVGQFDALPVGVAASREGRVFLAFSRSIDPTVPFSVAEVKGGKPVLFPPGFKQEMGAPAPDRLLAVQAMTVDARDRLWILDAAKVGTNTIQPGAPKLLAVDLKSGKVVKRVSFPAEVAGPTAFLNDVRVDLSRGKEGMAFLTDASAEGPNGLLVVDLATGKVERKLANHPSTRPEPLTLTVHGTPLVQQQGPAKGKPLALGSDGIALGADGKWLYYSPLTGRHLYRVSADALATRPDAEVAKTVEDLGDKGFASDGLLEDAQGRVYLTDCENDAVHRRTVDGRTELVVKSPELRWPDTLALESDGTLLITVTQIDLSPLIQGQDKRKKPFAVYQVKTDSRPVMRGPQRAQARPAPGR